MLRLQVGYRWVAFSFLLFDRSFASSIVNSALAWNIFDIPFVKRKFFKKMFRGWTTFRIPRLLASVCPLTPLNSLVGGRTKQVRPGELFHRYAVLGDDIVIADEAVAQSYSSALTSVGWGSQLVIKSPSYLLLVQ